MSALLEVEELRVAYGKFEAVRGVSFAIEPGQVVTIIGPNGAGKSTTLLATIGLLPSKGRLSFEGRDFRRLDVEARVAHGLSLVPEKRELFGNLSVLDNLQLGAYSRGESARAMRDSLREVFDRFPRLEERKSQLASTLSGGERQMLALGRALMSRPRLLLLDEPSLGLAPLIVREIFSILQTLRRSGVSILLVEQNARAALELADYAYVMEIGEISLAGRAEELIGDERIVSSYLGGVFADEKPAAIARG